jgi:protein-disulfide isomerase
MARKDPAPSEAARRRQRQAAKSGKTAATSASGSTSAAKPTGTKTSSSKSSRSQPAAGKRPLWASPTVLVTFAAIIVTLVLVYTLSNKSNPSVNALVAPANPVPVSIARNGTTLGTSNAPVKMETWEDFQCPYCDIWTLQWEPNLIRDFVAPGTMTYTFNNYAFLGDGHKPNESLDAAVAASCADDQGKFWEYHDWLYANQNPNGENRGWFVTSTFDAIAAKVGLNQATFDTCLADPAKASAVQAERTAGSALGVDETPTIFVNGKIVALTTYQDLANLIRSLAPAAPSPAASSGPPASPAPASPAPASLEPGASNGPTASP